MTDLLTLKDRRRLTPDTHAYTFTRPEGFSFTPGHATELAIQREGWREKGRPFTFTSLPDADHLEFVIKSYPDHEGVTDQLPTLRAGEMVAIEAPFGALSDRGPGTFIAAGAGITPFLAILRARAASRRLGGCRLIYTNKTAADIILHDELSALPGLTSHFTVTDEAAPGVEKARIDRGWLKGRIEDVSGRFYLCGPQGFVDDIRSALQDLGASRDMIHTEEGW
ncbi:FAD-binding oxidoreductase [Oceanicola sp. S124]|uniref:FAD-binding oxidoreductase n=1 Tax=Oceanicola sp. S124 TaxID=1042378 RepID=UPI000255934E|nr:FAD-binding oxidoreductase [Oceanicola sp. S124]